MTQTEEVTKRNYKVKGCRPASPCGLILFVAYFGAAVYFAHLANGFWGIVLALLKAAIWPAYVLYHVLGLLNVR